MPNVERTIRVVTEQHATEEIADSGMPWRKWNTAIYAVDENGNNVPANMFDKVTYTLHETFGDRYIQTLKKPPFKVAEQGWGEFEMNIELVPHKETKGHNIRHDLNFQSNKYEVPHKIVFRNPKPELIEKLKETGETPDGADGGRKRGDTKRKKDKFVDMEKLADGMQSLQEDDMLHIVQMVYDHKTADTYTKNDVENGEFSVDLYTLPDALVKMLWDFTSSKVPGGL